MQALPKKQLLLAGITVAALAPFLNKAFHIDDPLFIWMAQHIAKHPLDPYGFSVNWVSFTQPISVVMQNPPLCSYFIAGVGAVFGWSESVLHLAFLFWSVMSILGTFTLGRRFCQQPLIAALFTLFTPVFLVSATSVMCDVMMLALWLWAIEFWLAGLEQNKWWPFLISALLISAASLTKYFGIALVPLLAVYTFARNRRLTLQLIWLLVPLAVISNYDFVTDQKYGHGLFSAATTVSSAISSVTRPSHFSQLLMGLAFSGGCFITAAFFMPLPARKIFLWAICAAAAFAVAFKFFIVSSVYLEGSEVPVWLEGGIFATIGLGVLALAALDFVREKNPDALLLFLWIIGTFCFATFLNWSITTRTLLPMTPAIAFLVVRQLERRQSFSARARLPLLPAAAVSLLLATADYKQAGCARSTAREFKNRYRRESGKVWFQGHWGFQYYMEQWGARAFDRKNPQISPGHILVGPFSDITPVPISAGQISARTESICRTLPFVSTAGLGSGASFYSSFGGPLPWVINRVPAERYYAVRVK